MSTPFAGGKVDFNAIEPGFEPLNTDNTNTRAIREERSFASRDPDFDRRAEREFDREDRAFAATPDPTPPPVYEEFRRDDASAFAPTPAFAQTTRTTKKGGMNPAFIAIPVIAVVGVGAALLLTSNQGAEEPDLGASLPVETAQAPLANPTLPPAAPIADTAVVPPAPAAEATTPAARVAPAPARRAAPRVERAAAPAAAPAAADDLGVDASATLPGGPTTYSQLDRSGDPAPQAINPSGTVTAPAGVTTPPATTSVAPVTPPAPVTAVPQPVTPPEPAATPEAPAVDTTSPPQ